MAPDPEVVVEASAADLAANTASRAIASLGAALQTNANAHLVVTGGSILEAVLTALGAPERRDALDWGRVHVWWGDERYVPADSDDRNDKAAFATPFGALPFEPANVHRMPAADAGFGDDVEAAADSYAAELASAASGESDGSDVSVPHFDVALIGIGPDGHCASLFPDHPGVRVTDAAVIAVRNSPKPPPNRISLTLPSLDAADEICFIASGQGKADAVAQALSGADPIHVPSAGPRGRRRTLWLLDQDAAAELPPPA
jgi:6-phosphogluconolactonase